MKYSSDIPRMDVDRLSCGCKVVASFKDPRWDPGPLGAHGKYSQKLTCWLLGSMDGTKLLWGPQELSRFLEPYSQHSCRGPYTSNIPQDETGTYVGAKNRNTHIYIYTYTYTDR